MSGTFPHDWTPVEDNEPTSTGLLGMTDDYIIETRQMVRERIGAEHNFDLTVDEEQGTHKQGSARIWISESEPAAPSPDMTSPDTSGDVDTGRLWFKPSTVSLYAYKKGATPPWVQIILTAEQLGSIINALLQKTSFASGDKMLVLDSSAGYAPKYITFSNIMTQLLNSNDSVITYPGTRSAGSATTAARADHVHPKGDAATLNGQDGSFYRNASNINAGVLAAERIPASLPGKSVGYADSAGFASSAGSVAGSNITGTISGSKVTWG